jgi:hypothetical protein
MSIAKKLIEEAIDRYGLINRLYEYDTEFNWVVVREIQYSCGHPTGVRVIATFLPESIKPPVAQLRLNF